MGRIKRRGEAGAAKAYVTRSAAIKKLQISLADFRRLCILKGIFPREPRSRKKANKGSSAPTSFYYAKDIAYLAHEPVLKKLREHKAFAKRFARALGRGEWSSAKSLEDHKPVYKIDHIVKERYPSFVDAVRDIDDALCLIFLFATLPPSPRVPAKLVESCARLAAEWQLYIIKAKALRKVFLSIKGVYYQAEIMGEQVTWLVPYAFTPNMPVDVDLRIMLTFLELYQTLLGFVMFRLYRDISLVYPPPLDDKRDEGAGGLGAFSLKVASDQASELNQSQAASGAPVKQVSSKAVKEAIKSITATAPPAEGDAMQVSTEPQQEATVSDDFVAQKSLVDGSSTELATLRVIQTQADTHGPNTGLFAPFTFFVSRETPRQLFEFVVRCFGGRIGWHPTQGVGSPISEDDESITHVIIDRPVVTTENETEERRLLRLRRKYVQPQWIMDSINAGKVLLEDDYLQGKTLPPHLSPFGEQEGAYQPMEARAEVEDEEIEGMSAEEDEDEVDEDDAMDDEDDLAEAVEDPSLLRAAELRAEAAGMDAGSFDKAVKQAKKKAAKGQTEKRTSDVALSRDEGQMNKMMMSNKQRKLYTKLKYTETKREAERDELEKRRRTIEKQKKRRRDVAS